MAYAEFLKRTLKPLGLYELNDGFGADEIACEGKALDYAYDTLEALDLRRNADTATTEQLGEYEKLLHIAVPSQSEAERRSTVKAVLGMQNRCMTLSELNRILPACGADAEALESDTALTVIVKIKEAVGNADKLAEIKRRIEAIVPCHLNVIYDI